MSEKRFVCIDVGYGDDWYITDNGKRLSEIEIVDLLNKQQVTINKLKEENDRIKTKGLDILAFYESKLKDAVGTEDFQCVRDEIWIVRQVLYEMGVIDDK